MSIWSIDQEFRFWDVWMMDMWIRSSLVCSFMDKVWGYGLGILVCVD
jgi:hypothetical protein